MESLNATNFYLAIHNFNKPGTSEGETHKMTFMKKINLYASRLNLNFVRISRRGALEKKQ